MVGAARPLIEAATDAQFMAPWTLKHKGQEVFTMPRISVVRAWVFNHAVHHRGQMSLYLRLNDVPVHPFPARARTNRIELTRRIRIEDWEWECENWEGGIAHV